MSAFKRAFQRRLLGLARSLTPVLTLGGRTLVFRYADVIEILNRDQDFTIGPINGENIGRHIGPFILGMDDGPEYQRDVTVLRQAVQREDTARVVEIIREEIAQITSTWKGEVDIVEEFTRKIPLRVVGRYFGCPGPNDADMLRWNRSLFWDVFLDLSNDAQIRANATKSAKEMGRYLRDLAADKRRALEAGGRLPDDFYSRLVGLAMDRPFMTDAWLAGNVSGVYMGFLEPTSKACVNILRVLQDRKEVLAAARKAAEADDMDAMRGICMEAMRFYPNAPLVMRANPKDQTIGGNGRKKRKLKAGKTLFVMTGTAMFDKRAIPEPYAFRTDRPMSSYLFFGHGLHTCFGNYINMASIPAMMIGLLKVPGLKPVAKPEFEGPFPDKWMFRVGD